MSARNKREIIQAILDDVEEPWIIMKRTCISPGRCRTGHPALLVGLAAIANCAAIDRTFSFTRLAIGANIEVDVEMPRTGPCDSELRRILKSVLLLQMLTAAIVLFLNILLGRVSECFPSERKA